MSIHFEGGGADLSLRADREYWTSKIHEEMSSSTPLFFRKLDPDNAVKEADACRNRLMFTWSEATSDRVMKLCGSSLPNTFAFFYSVVSMLLFKYSNDPLVTVEAPVLAAGGLKPSAVGKLPLILRTSGQYSFKDWLNKAQKVIKEAYQHSALPLHYIYSLAGSVDPEFSLRNMLLMVEGMHDITDLQHYENEIILILHTGKGSIGLEVLYDPACFSGSHIQGCCMQLEQLIQDALSRPETDVSELSILPEAERRKLIKEFNGTGCSIDRPMTIHECFEEQAVRTPDQIALIFGDERLTYQEVNERSGRLAKWLRMKGVGPDTVVGLLAERSAEMIIGLLAILKAGGAYLPIDPDYPAERIRYMLEHSRTQLLLTHRAGDFTTGHPCEQLRITDLLELPESGGYEAASAEGGHLAYVIYTSGSTGQPKGVMIEHRQVVNFAAGMASRLELERYSSFLCVTTVSFDIFVLEAIVPLLYGMQVVLSVKGEDIDGRKLAQTMTANSVDIMQTTPSRLQLLLNDEAFRTAARQLKVILCGGEALPVQIVSRLAGFRQIRLFNMYGPTETTVWSLVAEVDINGPIRIGRPIQNTEVFILDENGALLPIGAVGELCIGGQGLARGYLFNEPETGSRFVPSPFGEREKLYKTGDMARWHHDGTLEFCGRKDNQLKIRGYRIEPGEIEERLLKLAGITEVKVVDKDVAGNKFLCAYYVADRSYTPQTLRNEMKSVLPDYMVPAHFIRLDCMPYTDNGKTNLRILKELPFEERREWEAPDGADEAFLLDELRNALNLSEIGVTDPIFEFGANSLNIMRFVQRIQSSYEIQYEDIVQSPTIREIAAKAVPRKRGIAEVMASYNRTGPEQIPEEIHSGLSRYRADYLETYKDISAVDITGHNNILLTGSTGYLGIHLLRGLLDGTSSTLTLIIRGADVLEAENRLSRCYFYYFRKPLEPLFSRLKIIAGDLTEDNFGMEREAYRQLAESISCVINSAADVSHYGLYETFRKANVQSVAHLIEFCLSGSKKDLYHISTTSVGNGYLEDKQYQLVTEEQACIGQQAENYYVASKAEAEKLVLQARGQGINTTIFRVGNLVFQSATGRCQENVTSNAFYQRLRSFLELGRMPDIRGMDMELSYVDKVSEAIMRLLFRPALHNEIFHICNPHLLPYSQFAGLAAENGYELQMLEPAKFADFLVNHYEEARYREAVDVLLVHFNLLARQKSTQVVLSSEKTVYILERLGFLWEPANPEHIRLMLEFGSGIGFFRSPELISG
ncbi:non-ribosomal peptide synthetase [Paenibacillus sp. PK3_47]|uniref:non-ribosomal peptide synthetase family protein n=1 Tax=Paenibacillus sp. PK3_47 TaxID=2072642 RepID=UPI00201DA72C|nr:non-ribosomal peptide synthetase [Paenibacillus sp. PK3_47]